VCAMAITPWPSHVCMHTQTAMMKSHVEHDGQLWGLQVLFNQYIAIPSWGQATVI
jgi:hypothetical protein